MRVAGGVLGIVFGVIMIILGGLVVLGLSAASGVGDAMLEGSEYSTMDEAIAGMEADIEEMRNTEGVTEEQITAAETALETFRSASEDAGSIGTWYLIELIGGILALILGIMVCSSKSSMNGMLLGLVGLILTVVAVLMWPGWFDLIVSVVVLLGGFLAYTGAKQDTAPAA